MLLAEHSHSARSPQGQPSAASQWGWRRVSPGCLSGGSQHVFPIAPSPHTLEGTGGSSREPVKHLGPRWLPIHVMWPPGAAVGPGHGPELLSPLCPALCLCSKRLSQQENEAAEGEGSKETLKKSGLELRAASRRGDPA